MTSYKSFFKYLCPLIALSPYLALAQHGEPIDVSKCFSNILIVGRAADGASKESSQTFEVGGTLWPKQPSKATDASIYESGNAMES